MEPPFGCYSLPLSSRCCVSDLDSSSSYVFDETDNVSAAAEDVSEESSITTVESSAVTTNYDRSELVEFDEQARDFIPHGGGNKIVLVVTLIGVISLVVLILNFFGKG